MIYSNPVLSGFYPDPSICRVGDNFYLVTSSFGYMPGVPLFHSRDLVHWQQLGNVLTRESQLEFAQWSTSGGIFAPTIRHHQGTFYMVTTNVSGKGNFLVHTRDITGEWSDPLWLDQEGIDPSLFFDEDGKVYLTTSWSKGWPAPAEVGPEDGHWGILQSEIDLSTGKRLTEPRVIWAGTGGRYPEGPHLYKIQDHYHLLIAEGGTERGHMVTLARSHTPWGPWEPCPHNPILSHRSLQSPFQALGHADLVETQTGEWWMVCLGIRPQGNPETAHLGRETFLVPVQWNPDGWPVVGDQGKLRTTHAAPSLPAHPWPQNTRDPFEGPTLGPEWVSLGHPGKDMWMVENGTLKLQGNALTLQDGAGVAFVGQRQKHHQCKIKVQLDFDPQQPDQEAGLTVWMDPQHHFDLLVSLQGENRTAQLRRQVDGMVSLSPAFSIQEGPVTLRVQATSTHYIFAVQQKNTQQELGKVLARYLSPEVAGGFTGVILGLYSTGNGNAQVAPARFSGFSQTAGDA